MVSQVQVKVGCVSPAVATSLPFAVGSQGTETTTILPAPSRTRMEAKVEAVLVALPYCFCVLPDRRDLSCRCLISGPV